MLQLMLLPFLACLVLTGIHAYLGMHIIKREVIFVDLALAQIAALGAVVAFLFGIELHSMRSYIVSMIFTFLGATIFALTRLRKKDVPQEAIIGIVYAVTAAASILVLSKAPMESEHLKDMLVGNILFVKEAHIMKMLVLYSIIGVFHFVYRKYFFAVSDGVEKVGRRKISVKWWDFLFYASLGVVVTSSVEIAGVLLVFSYLIVPAVCAIMITNNLKARLIIGWSIGTITSLIGLYLSAMYDFPTGAAIVCSFGLIILVIWVVRYFLINKKLY